jgi:hypothetical protein
MPPTYAEKKVFKVLLVIMYEKIAYLKNALVKIYLLNDPKMSSTAPFVFDYSFHD